MIYYILAYIVGAALYNMWCLRDIKHYMTDPDEDKDFDEFRKHMTEEQVQNFKKNLFKGLAFILSIFWPIMVIFDFILITKKRNYE